MSFDLNYYRDLAASASRANGWHDDIPEDRDSPEFISWLNTKLFLIVSEVVEGFEEIRNGHPPLEIYLKDGKPEGLPVEMADGIIRLLDLSGILGLNIDMIVRDKINFNKSRGFKHGNKAF